MWKNFPNIRFFVCQSLLSFSRFLKKEGKKERGERKKKRKSYLGLKRYSNFSKLNEEEFWGTEIDFGEKKLKEKIYLDMEREKKEKEEEKGRNQKKRIDDSLSVRDLLLGIGEKMKQPAEKMEKYITILEKNWFDSVGSLKDLGSADYEKMEFPLRLSVEIQKQVFFVFVFLWLYFLSVLSLILLLYCTFDVDLPPKSLDQFPPHRRKTRQPKRHSPRSKQN